MRWLESLSCALLLAGAVWAYNAWSEDLDAAWQAGYHGEYEVPEGPAPDALKAWFVFQGAWASVWEPLDTSEPRVD